MFVVVLISKFELFITFEFKTHLITLLNMGCSCDGLIWTCIYCGVKNGLRKRELHDVEPTGTNTNSKFAV